MDYSSSSDDDEEMYLNTMKSLIMDEQMEDENTPRSTWQCEFFEARDDRGCYAQTFQDLLNDRKKFKQHTRLTPELFHMLLELVQQDIQKEDTDMRKSISAGEGNIAINMNKLKYACKCRALLFC